MANQEHIEELHDTFNNLREKSGVNDLQELYNQTSELAESISKDGFREDIKQEFFNLFNELKEGERETVGKTFTIKNGAIYTYGSSGEVNLHELIRQSDKLIDNFSDRIEEDKLAEMFEEVERASQEISNTNMNEFNSKKIINESFDREKTFHPDETGHDAVMYNVSGYGEGVQLVSLDSGSSSSCSGKSLHFNTEKACHLERLMRYQTHIREVLLSSQDKMQEEAENRREVVENIRNLH